MTSPALNQHPNFAVRFEKMLSVRIDGRPCLRDLIYSQFVEAYGEEVADEYTKDYIEKLWNSFGR